ncbi:WhiB family transcriptional regulator [Kitasatospora sp. DSM 101779]|uniref:WhiB family transcriptional regulator n=1 Tax=Kitasatospora sp. DSM 101779 TaxID=2853165 RepID=UPI0021DB6F4D|nr:WhiB family transcriptional regulator [Kitasatospora sp. DSM 101779]MCU7823866.1 WhiB family transcriptional regulator [Kitasatospora sp. DSM 101779]
MMARFVRRGIRGTSRPHLTARPTGPAPVVVVAPTTGNLPGAACLGVDPDLFFPDHDTDPDGAAFAELRAKQICGTCPVRAACLDAAIARRERHGIFGGLNSAQRARLAAALAKRAQRARTVVA